MDIPRPDNFNETYLYEGTSTPLGTDLLDCKPYRMLTTMISFAQS